MRFVFGDVDPVIKVIHVDEARRPTSVQWTVLECNALPEWPGTKPRFDLRPLVDGGCELQFRHEGLAPQLECYSSCRAGWDQFLSSLHDYVDHGQGRPYGPTEEQ